MDGPGYWGVAFVGIDLAWGYRARTGAAAVDATGRLLAVDSLLTDGEIHGWVRALPTPPVVVAIDAPLVVPNELGMRDCERLVARAYGRYGAGCHPSNTTRMPTPRGSLLAAGRWTVDARPGAPAPVCVEVHPHAAMVGLFRLPYRVAYKRGPFPLRLRGFQQLIDLVETWSALRLEGSPEWAALTRAVASAVRLVELDRVEDQLDAVVCAGLALLHHRGELAVYGDPTGAHVVAPPPPTHPAMRVVTQRHSTGRMR